MSFNSKDALPPGPDGEATISLLLYNTNMGLKGDMLNSGSGESVLYNQVCLLKPLLNITMANLVVVGDVGSVSFPPDI